MNDNPGENLTEEPQEERGAPGSRDTGSDQAAGGSSGRVPGDIDHEETTSVDDEDEQSVSPQTTQPPQDVEPALPPYEGRKESANPEGATSGGGATSPSSTSRTDEPDPAATPGGQYASPAAEEPVSTLDERASDAGGTGPGHVSGTEKGEDQR